MYVAPPGRTGSGDRDDLGGLVSATRVLEVVIATTFMFYLTALLSSGLVEWLANLMKKRSKYLLRGLKAILEGHTQSGELRALTGLVSFRGQVRAEAKLYARLAAEGSDKAGDLLTKVTRHPLILGFAQSRSNGTVTRLPSYVPARTFVTALFDELPAAKEVVDDELKSLKKRIEALGNDEKLKKSLLALLRTHGKDLETFGSAVEGWYDDQMDRISGAYKRWAKRWIAVIGVGVALAMHLDAVGLAIDLWHDEPARAAIVKAADGAEDCRAKTDADERATCIDGIVDVVAAQGPPIGPQAWRGHADDGHLWRVLLGILLTGAAASLGAPFWFDALGRLNSLRNSGPKPAPSKKA